MPRPQWTRAQCRVVGRKGGAAPRKTGVRRTPEYRAGFKAGWVTCERFWKAKTQRELVA